MSTQTERLSTAMPNPRAQRESLLGEPRGQHHSGPVALACARRVGRYLLLSEIARGGMATVHLGRAVGDHGFYRRVAIKRLLPQFARDPQFTAMMLDEARIASCVDHPNVAGVRDVVREDDELFLVLDYIQGDTLARLMRRAAGTPVPLRIAASIVSGLLHGLFAAHEARDEYDEPLDIVHRDISPQNVMVGIDGITRVLDFGIAKAFGSSHNTSRGDIKGKLSYMAPEQLSAHPATQKSDIFSAGIVLWEALTGRRLFDYASEREAFARPLDFVPPTPSSIVPGLSEALDAVVLRALAPEPEDRFGSAREMALALEAAADMARPSEVGVWVEELMRKPPMVRPSLSSIPAPPPSQLSFAEELGLEVEPTHATRVERRSGSISLPTQTQAMPVLAKRKVGLVALCVTLAAFGYLGAQRLLKRFSRHVDPVVQVKTP
jgi:serine/threonine-protein kinase